MSNFEKLLPKAKHPTGDKKLIKGLEQKGIDWILSAETIKQNRNEE